MTTDLGTPTRTRRATTTTAWVVGLVLVVLAVLHVARASYETGAFAVTRPDTPELLRVLDRDYRRSDLPLGDQSDLPSGQAVVAHSPGGAPVYGPDGTTSGYSPTVLYVLDDGELTTYALVGGP